MKKAPNPALVDWLRAVGDDFYISAISMEELHYGALRMSEGKRRRAILAAIDAVTQTYGHRVLSFTEKDAETCARLRALAWGSGQNITYQDIAICATALNNNLVVATRNTRDFEPLGASTFNPFGT